jgi:S-adenosylmethionine:tRNA ribosyltransferase-isomerase
LRVLTRDFDFDLPLELIAQQPAEPRDQARLMVLRRSSAAVEHLRVADLPELLAPGDLLARNNSRVVPARLVGRRDRTGGAWEGLFLSQTPEGDWEVLAKTRGKPEPGEHVRIAGSGGHLVLRLDGRRDGGRWLVRPEGQAGASALALLDRFGQVPLPPYIRKGREGPGDRERYQTTYARVPGSVAAPTAGLHFTPELFSRLAARGIGAVDLTLHVGIGTFRPIEAEDVDDHVIHQEWAEVSPKSAGALNAAREAGSSVVAIGTTSARTLETAAGPEGRFRPFAGPTGLFLKPGHAFRGLDVLLTNFHLPRSSLLVLVAALIGLEPLRAAYAEAIRRRYRFYSYGDAMLILP